MCKKISLQQEVNPKAPVLAAHHLHRFCYLLLGSRLDGSLLDDVAFQINREGSECLADGLEHRLVRLAGNRVGSEWTGKRVDDQVDLPELFLDFLCNRFLDLVAESIPENRDSFQSPALGNVLESHRVVPTRGCCLVLARLALEAHVDGVAVVSECGNDA
ncbi:hypothetical protein DSECCO2_523660 [anaerobic digester metagenome]